MKYAIVDGKKREAQKSGELGKCICCGKDTIAHCGKIKVNHWKHKSLQVCDSWSELETEWHRSWKNQFPSNFQEVVMKDLDSGEKHIADIYNAKQDVVIEIQNSPITIEEINSREQYYNKLIWIVNLQPYIDNIKLHENILNGIYDAVYLFWQPNLNKRIKELRNIGNYFEAEKIKNEEDEYYSYLYNKYYFHNSHLVNAEDDYFLLEWKYQHKRWNYTSAHLFFDLGDSYVYMVLESIKIWNGFIVKRFKKEKFISKYSK